MSDRAREIRERVRSHGKTECYIAYDPEAPADLEWCLSQLEAVTRERDEARGRLKAMTNARDSLLGSAERADYGDRLLSRVRDAHARQVVRTKQAEAERDAALKREGRLRDHIADALDLIDMGTETGAKEVLKAALADEGRE